jgi:hypothetical protein
VRRYPKLAADAGRIVANRDLPTGELKLSLFNAPSGYSPGPMMFLAASAPGPVWRRQYVEISHAGRSHMMRTPRRKSTLGEATTRLGAGGAGSVEVLLHDPDQWLVSCTEDDLKLGDNLAAFGSEILQFSETTPLGGGRFRLAGLARGQEGTAVASHPKGAPFVLIDRAALEPIYLPVWVPGVMVRASTPDGSAECSLMPELEGPAPRRSNLKL